MYKRFYNLRRNPFEITPDPSFLFPTRRHNEALAALYYGVRRHKGFVVMTGEVGTGKTLLVRCLLQLLNRSDVAYAYIFNSRLSPLEFLQYVAGDFGLVATGKNKSEVLLELSSYLIARHQKKLTTVLVVDEAHHLSADVLEEIRLLTNLETAQEKLMQILLVGQPELDEKLDSHELRQLKQRVALRSQLEPLNQEETKGYIQRRLHLAGANSDAGALFPADTVARVYRHSQGIPRLINTICENALITAYARQVRSVSADIVDEVAADFRLNVVHPAQRGSAINNTENNNAENNSEVWQAVKTLLQLHDQLQGVRSSEDESPMTVAPGAKHEPYI
jgi:general secretion pathway protein A